ncbi:hypothetical protein EV193_103221 [Herbihabitans rhizosphaerae]|uniref:Capsular polysaccharide biosynthesis protein n=1 Tax=Herbihabitans rhizosphaerae TaxID=1872711 RepID=A0A4Q7KWF1_9PSEU|nr:hypothetical protein [Herbihabitans rhizosphaerae]RZS40906.1 hypothetical protein EV193_103221 [Herbihabitans rhizosphaerae]
MDFWKTVLVLLRRWYIAVPVFLVTIGVAVGVYAAVPMRYESTGTVVLTSPANGANSEAVRLRGVTNPLLSFDVSLGVSASIVIQSLSTPEVRKQLGAGGSDTAYEITGGEIGGPFIIVTAESTSEPGSKALVERVLARVNKELSDRQTALQAPRGTFIGVEQVVMPTLPEAQRGGKLRAGGVALALGLIATLGAAFALESIQQARARRTTGDRKSKRRKENEPTGEPEWPVEDDVAYLESRNGEAHPAVTGKTGRPG